MPDITSLSTDYPFLLFPVQVQVKFVRNTDDFVAAHPGRTPRELRIRVYPDQIGLNTHEQDLTDAEVAAGQTYWKTAPDYGAHTLHAIGPWRVLVGRYGSNRALWIVRQTTPTNLEQLQAGTAAGPVFPVLPTQAARWTQPATSLVMPAYFTAILYEQVDKPGDITDPYISQQLLPRLKATYSPELFPDATSEFLRIARQVDGAHIADGPLQVGPDPQSGKSGLNDEAQLAWMADFEQALAQGLALVVPLSAAEYERGFKRLVVLGVREDVAIKESAKALQKIFTNHLHTGGLALVPQGTPTNNTESAAAGFNSAEASDAEASFQALVQGALFQLDTSGDLLKPLDGQHFTASLGLDPAEFEKVGHGDGTDGREARLMNRALWPATYGYFLEEMLRPLFSPAAIAWTRTFFQDYVLGRGAVPAFRVHNEPYGVLTTTRFSAWQATASLDTFGQQLLEVLRHLDVTWTERLNEVAAYPSVLPGGVAGATPIPSQQNLLTTLGSDATSVEYYQRYMLGPNVVDTLNSYAQTQRKAIWPLAADDDAEPAGRSQQRTAGRFGTPTAQQNPLYSEFLQFFDGTPFDLHPGSWPHLFDQSFQSSFQLIAHTFADVPPGTVSRLGSVVDATPLSETAPVQPFSGTTVNYLHWLATASFDEIRRENFSRLYGGQLPTHFAPPSALLYRLLRHAVLLQYWQAAANTVALPASQRMEKEFFNVLDRDSARWELLYQDSPQGQGMLHESLQQGQGPHGAQLVAYLGEVAALATVPTARLERVMAEHLDLGNYRLDAWKTALVAHRLAELRKQNSVGNHLGAFSWLEDLKADDKSTVAATPEQVSEGRNDPDNLGYIHAPSLNHATTAAILRQGYKSRQHTVDGSDPTADRMSINLSSERVRKALAILQGIRAGQSLSALLGQEFEKALSAHAGTVAGRPFEYFLQNLRQRFPYTNEKKLVGQPVPSSATVDAAAARQVVDGLALAQAGGAAYPFGDSTLPQASGGAEATVFVAAVKQEITALLDTLDALGDLTVGESIYQAVMGNTEQAGAMLDSIAKGKFPVNPEIVHPRTPGVSLTHRVLVHLPQADPSVLAEWGNATPLARAMPGLNRWLAGFFGRPSDILLAYSGAPTTDASGNPGPLNAGTITLNVLALHPVDLLYLLDNEALRQGSTLDTYLRYAIAPDAAGAASLAFDYASAGALVLRRLLPLTGRLRQLVAGSRAAGPRDLQTTAGAGATQAEQGIDESELTTRFAGLLQTMQTLITALPTAGSIFGTVTTTQARQTIVHPPLPTPHQVRPLLRQAAAFGVAEAINALTAPNSTVVRAAGLVRAALAKRLLAAQQALSKRPAIAATPKSGTVVSATSLASPNEVGAYLAAGEALFGPSFRLTLCFSLPDSAESRYEQAVTATGLLRHHTANPLIMQEWLQGVAAVRDPLDHLSKVILINDLLWDEATGHALPELQPAQLSATPATGAYWLGVPYPDTYAPVGDAVSLVQLLPPSYSPTGPQCALWLDEWTELLPESQQTTAVAFHYDQPNTSAPQSLLLVVSPDSEQVPTWSFEHLLGAVNETLDLAKKRTVQPDALAFTHLSTLLPALVAPVSQHGVTFTLDYRSVNRSARFQGIPLDNR